MEYHQFSRSKLLFVGIPTFLTNPHIWSYHIISAISIVRWYLYIDLPLKMVIFHHKTMVIHRPKPWWFFHIAWSVRFTKSIIGKRKGLLDCARPGISPSHGKKDGIYMDLWLFIDIYRRSSPEQKYGLMDFMISIHVHIVLLERGHGWNSWGFNRTTSTGDLLGWILTIYCHNIEI